MMAFFAGLTIEDELFVYKAGRILSGFPPDYYCIWGEQIPKVRQEAEFIVQSSLYAGHVL